MYFLNRLQNVGRVTEERQPHVFNMRVVKAFVNRPIEFVPGRIRDNWPGKIRRQSPHIAHSHAELLRSRSAGNKISFHCV